jgi:hypothetical protein
MPWTRSISRGPAPGWPVHGSTVDSFHGLWQGLARAWPSGRSGPRRLAARVETGRARHGATGGPLTRARMTVRRRRDVCGEWQRSEFDAGVEESLKAGGGGAGVTGGPWGFIYGAGGAPERR